MPGRMIHKDAFWGMHAAARGGDPGNAMTAAAALAEWR